jgi:hypothetical protein
MGIREAVEFVSEIRVHMRRRIHAYEAVEFVSGIRESREWVKFVRSISSLSSIQRS